jgi:hypothetical protein
MARGYAENVEFFRIDYLDPDDVDLGTQIDVILPSLWLAAGGVGCRDTCPCKGFAMPGGSRYAVLFDESAFRCSGRRRYPFRTSPRTGRPTAGRRASPPFARCCW